MARRVYFATTAVSPTPPGRRVPVADDAWGNEYLVPAVVTEPAGPRQAAVAVPPPPPPLPLQRQSRLFPTLRALCLTTLAQHLFLLNDVATTNENPDILRHSIPCADDRLALAAAARRRSELSSTPLFLALADPCWPVLCIGGAQQPPVQAVVEAAKSGLLRGARKVEWVLPSEAGGVATTPTTPNNILLPSEAASLVRSLASHCDSLEELHLKRSDPARATRPAVAAAVAKAVLGAALPKGLVAVVRRPEEEEEEEEQAPKQQAAPVDSWEDALPADDQKPTPKMTTFPPSFRLLRWQDLPDAAADAMTARCPRIALDRRKIVGGKAAPEIDTPWLSMLAPGWDDRAALLQEQREQELARREAARGKGLLAAVAVSVSEDESDEDNDVAEQPQHESESDDEPESIAAKFKRAYIERAQRLKQVEKAKEAQRRRKEVRASPSLGLVERWLDEPV